MVGTKPYRAQHLPNRRSTQACPVLTSPRWGSATPFFQVVPEQVL